MTTPLVQALITAINNQEKANKILALISEYEPETLLNLTVDDKSLLFVALERNFLSLASELLPLYLTEENFLIAAGPENKTILHILSEFGNIDGLMKLISYLITQDQLVGCINDGTDNGDTALHLALDPVTKNFNRVQTIALLINAGARCDLHNNQNLIAGENLFKLPAELQLAIFIKLEDDKKLSLLKFYKKNLLQKTFNNLDLYYKLCEKHSLKTYLIANHEFNSNIHPTNNISIPKDLLISMPLYAEKLSNLKNSIDDLQTSTDDTLLDDLDNDKITLFNYKQQFNRLLSDWQKKVRLPSGKLSALVTFLSCSCFSLIEAPLIYYSTQENESEGAIYTTAVTFGLASIFAEIIFSYTFHMGFFHEKRLFFSNEWKSVIENFKNEVLIYLQQLDTRQKENNPSHSKSANLFNLENNLNYLEKTSFIMDAIQKTKYILICLDNLQKELIQQKISFSTLRRLAEKEKFESIIDIPQEDIPLTTRLVNLRT